MNLRLISCCLICFFILFNISHSVADDTIHNDLKILVKGNGQRVTDSNKFPPVKIAFATPLKQISDYWRRSIDSFKARMDEIGLEYRVDEFSTRIDEKRKLRESIRLALATQPDYLVVTPNDPGDKDIISRLLGSKSKVKIIIQNMTIPDDDWHQNPPFMYVGFDHTIGASLLAEEYIKRFSKEKNISYAMLYHIRDNQVSRLRGDFFNKHIQKHSDFKLISEYYTMGDKTTSYTAALKILTAHPDIRFIYACATDVAFGAVEALAEKNLEQVILVNGWGGGSRELEALLTGNLNLTVMRMNDDNGVAMAEAIRLDLESKILKTPIIFSGEMVVVSQGIEDAEIKRLKKRAFRYSGNQ